MASKEQVFGVLYKASVALGREELGEKVGQPVREWQKQLKGWMDKGFIKDTGDQHYALTDAGREESLKVGEFKGIEDIENLVIDETKQTVSDGNGEGGASKIAVATTEKQQFLRLGKLSGVVPLSLIVQTADYVWEGGDYKDMKWVAQAMQELGLDKDVRLRWWHCWRAKMHQSIPTDLPAEFLTTETKKPEEKKEGVGKRDYIMGENDNPTYVGEGLGDLDHTEALDLARIRASAKGKGSGQSKSESPGDFLAAKAVDKVIANMGQEPSTPVDEGAKFIAMYKAFMELQGLNAKPDSNDDLAKFSSFYKVMKEITGDNKPVANLSPVKQWLYDNRTGEVKEAAPGQPVIIIRESAQAQSTPIQMKDKDGNPMILDLSTFIKLEEHRNKQRHDEESHETKMEIAKSFKDMLNKAGTALSHIVEGGEEEK